MRELAIVLGLIKQDNNYLLQLRDGDPKIGAANLIGCFGGKIEQGEEPVSAICRELREETTLEPSRNELRHMGSIEVISDHNLEDVKIQAEVFLIDIGKTALQAKEGQLVLLTADEAASALYSMTPGTRAVFEQFVLDEA